MCICAKKAKKIKAQLETDKRQRGKYQAFPEKEEEKRRKELERERGRERVTMWRTSLKDFLWGHNKGPSENTVA